MPIEYAGYQPISQIDWSALSDKLAKKAIDIGIDRAGRKAALDKQMSDYELKLANQEAFKTESLNNKWLDMAQEGRNLVVDANKNLKAGLLKENEYKKILSSLSDYTTSMATTAKSYDERIQAHLARQQPDKDGKIAGSQYELELMNRFGQMTDLKNKKFNVLPDGKIAVNQIDPQTGEVTQTFDLMSMNKAENMLAPRVDLNAATSKITEDWKKYGTFKLLGKEGFVSIEDVRNQPKYRMAVQQAAQAVNNSPKNTLSILVDNGPLTNPQYAYTDKQIEEVRQSSIKDLQELKKQAGLSIELTKDELQSIDDNIIRVDEYGTDPILTDRQKKLANETVVAAIEQKLEREITVKAPEYNAPQIDYGGYGYGSTRPKTAINYYPEMRRAWDMARDGTQEQRILGAGQLTSLAQGKARFTWTKEGLNVETPYKDSKGKMAWRLDATVSDLPSIQKYIYGKDNPYFDIDRQEFINVYGLGDTVTDEKGGAVKSKYTEAQEKNIEATMKANPGATREQVIKAFNY